MQRAAPSAVEAKQRANAHTQRNRRTRGCRSRNLARLALPDAKFLVAERDGAGAPIPAKARAMHDDALQLWVVTTNARARALYERCGFVFTGREKIDDYGEPIVHYRKELRGSP